MNVIDFENLKSLIRKREDETVKYYVEFCDLFEEFDSRERTLLHYAAEYGNKVITKYLLDRGCPVNHEDKDKITAFMLAMEGNEIEIMQILIETGADVIGSVHFFTSHIFSPTTRLLYLQELQKKYSRTQDMVEKLISANVHIYQIVVLNNAKLTEQLLSRGLSSNSVKPVENLSALHIAVIHSHVEIVRMLLAYHANVNAIDNVDANPLFYIYHESQDTTSEKVEILKMLINFGASLMTRCLDGTFQISRSLVYGNHEVVRTILGSDVDFIAKDQSQQRTILHYLAMNLNPRVADEMKHFISKCNVNVKDKCRLTPLMIAVLYGNIGIVKLLLENNAAPNEADEQFNFTAFYFALKESKPRSSENNYHLCIELLLQYNSDPQVIMTKNGVTYTLFDVASKTNNLHRMKPILAHLARLEALGTPINEIINSKIIEHEDLKQYFDSCKQMLRGTIFGSITVLELLTADRRKLASCFKNENRLLKLERLSYKSKAILFYTHYYISLRKRLSQQLYDKRFKKKAFEVVKKILPSGFPELVLDKITSYFNHEHLCQLYEF